MEYRKSFKVEGKVFNEDDILRLASIFEVLYKDDGYKIEFTVKSNNESSVSGSDLSIFETDYFQRKQIGKVGFVYYDSSLNKHIEVVLYNPLVFSDDSTVYIKSDDETWLNAVNSKIEGFFRDSIPQKAIWKLPKSLWAIIIPVVTSIIMTALSLIGLLNICEANKLIISDITKISITMIALSIFFIAISRIFPLIEKAYPRMEFRFGNHNISKSNEVRKIWSWLLGTIIIPVVLMIIGFAVGA